MPSDTTQPAHPRAQAEPPVAARHIMRTALKGTLASLDQETGHPYASLVLAATDPDGSPILLLSRLARHTRNLERDPRASLLLDATDGLGDPLAGGRVTLLGEVAPSASATARARFLARHPAAEAYAHFADFSFYQLRLASAHFIGGFGRIVDLPAADLLLTVDDALPLLAAEPEIQEHMNSDHSDAVGLYATELAGARAGPWRLAGIDPEGIDLVLGEKALRLVFPERIRTPAEARVALIGLAAAARQLKKPSP
jgi:heme oxygenase (biliverdin-IX-beta and delta-forming)